jgi:hypothetical protein
MFYSEVTPRKNWLKAEVWIASSVFSSLQQRADYSFADKISKLLPISEIGLKIIFYDDYSVSS